MHSCPECDEACYCGGDDDDSDTGDVKTIAGCTHCIDSYGDDYDFEDILPDDDSDD